MSNDILTLFGKNLQSARIEKGFTQEELAEHADLDRTYISLLERGKRNPSLICLLTLCKALKINTSDLCDSILLDKIND